MTQPTRTRKGAINMTTTTKLRQAYAAMRAEEARQAAAFNESIEAAKALDSARAAFNLAREEYVEGALEDNTQ